MTRLRLEDANGVRRELRLGKELSRGGAAGRICAELGRVHSVVKLYHTREIVRAHEPKIRAMLRRRPNLPVMRCAGEDYVQIGWPTDAVVDPRGRIVGFAMPLIDLGRSAELELLLRKASRRAERLPEHYLFRLTAARNLAATFAELHALGHYMIDAKPMNLRVYRRSAIIAVIDCDGFHITGEDGGVYPATHFTEGYIAPEAKGRRPDALKMNQDNFALAVMIFQLLNEGLHPYQGQLRRKMAFPADDIQTRIYAYSFPYGRMLDRRQKPSPFSVHEVFADETRTLFDQSFLGSARPSASLWRAHLDQLRNIATPCSKGKSHLDLGKGCIVCARERTVMRRSVVSFNGAAIPTVARSSWIWQTIVTHRLVKGRRFGKAAGAIIGVLVFTIIAVVGEQNRRHTQPTGEVEHAVEGFRPRPLDLVLQTSITAPLQSQHEPNEASSAGGTAAPALAVGPAARQTEPLGQGEVTATRRLNLRDAPSAAGRLLERVEAGTRLTVVETTEKGDWIVVERRGTVAYVSRRFTSALGTP
jgi:hypothetical protein